MAVGRQDSRSMESAEVCDISEVGQQERRLLENGRVSEPKPPDGGWGWIVCLAAFFSMLILDGMMFSFGVLFLELLDFFQASKSQTAMVGSALMGIHLIAGPGTSAMVNAWSIRTVAMTGSIMAAICFASSILAPNIIVVTILYGIMGGIGVSMIYLPSILAVNFYFEKKRALANGITQSGSGIGTFLYSPLTEFLLGLYGWKGTMLILSGLVLNCVACSALYIPIAKHRKCISDANHISNTRIAFIEDEEACEDLSTCDDRNTSNLRRSSHKAFSNSVPTLVDMSFSATNSPTSKRSRGRCKREEDRLRVVNTNIRFNGSTSPRMSLRDRAYSHGEMAKSSDYARHQISLTTKPLYKKDIFYSGSLLRIPEYQKGQSASLYLFSRNNLQLDTTHSGHLSNKTDNERSSSLHICDKLAAAKSMLHQMIGLKLVKNPKFILCMISMVMWTTHSSVLTILPDCAVLRGVSRDNAAILLSIIGVTNTAARILAGWISDRPEVNCLYVNMCSLALGGICCIAIAFSSSYLLLALESAIFGLCMGTWTSLRPIILVEVTGLDNLTNAFGLVAMFQGVAFLIGPPIAGALYECVISYTAPFIMAGIAFAISSVLCAVLCLCTRSACVKCGQYYSPGDYHSCSVVEVK